MTIDDLELKLSCLMRRLGFGDCASTVYSNLLFLNQPASLGEICDAVGYSPTAVSTALAELEETDLIMRQKRSRKYFYTADARFIRKFERGVEELLERELRPLRKSLEKRVESVRESAKDTAKKLLETVRVAERRLRSYVSTSKYSDSSERRE